MFDFKSIDIKSLITEALDIERARKTVVPFKSCSTKPLLLSFRCSCVRASAPLR